MLLQKSSAKIKKIRRTSVVLLAVSVIVFVIILPSAYLIAMNFMPRSYFPNAFFSARVTANLCVLDIFVFAIFSGFTTIRFGKAKAQSLHLYDDELVCGSYSGTDRGERQNREFYMTHISSVVSYRVTKRYIHIYGVFRNYVTSRIAYERKVRQVKLLRILEDEDESKMLRFLDGVITPEAQCITRTSYSKGSRQGDGCVTVSFLNTAYSPKKNKTARKVLRLFILAILVLASLSMLFEGLVLQALVIMLLGGVYVFFSSLNLRMDDIPTRMEFSEREFEVYYMNVDRHDKRGLRTEHYTVQYKNIRRISFDETSHKFCVNCLADIEIAFAGGNRPEDGRHPSPDNTELALYLTDDVLNLLMEKFTWICENQRHIENNMPFVLSDSSA